MTGVNGDSRSAALAAFAAWAEAAALNDRHEQ
jgi:hypothetical protein